MKKILTVIIILLLSTACSKDLKKLNLNSLEEKLKAKETFILYLTNEDEYGTTLKNTLLEVTEEKSLNTYYINTKSLKDEELKKLKEYFYFDDENIIIFVNNGVEETVLSRITDTYITDDNLKNELILQGFVD